MNRTDLAELIHHGENSGVEFKRDDVTPARLAKEMAAMLNLEGGHILLGVEKDRSVSGLTREHEQAEEWVMEVARAHLRPAAIPFWETLDWGGGKTVGIISLPTDAPDKPYKCRRGSAWVTQIRVGTTSRDATDDEEARLYMQSGRLQYDRKPVPGASLNDFDMRRLLNYFRDVRRQFCPPVEDREAWTRLLVNTEFMYEDRGRSMPSAGGLLLFGVRPQKYLPQAGISAAAYTGIEKDYHAKARETLRGAVVSLFRDPLDGNGAGISGLAANLFGSRQRRRVGRYRAGDGFRPPQYHDCSLHRQRRAACGAMGLSNRGGPRGHRERRRAPRLHH